MSSAPTRPLPAEPASPPDPEGAQDGALQEAAEERQVDILLEGFDRLPRSRSDRPRSSFVSHFNAPRSGVAQPGPPPLHAYLPPVALGVAVGLGLLALVAYLMPR